MDGLYLYCIREETGEPAVLHEKGIDEKTDVFTIAYRGLEAVVSQISLSRFASREIQKKAQEDLNWIRENAVIHESVIEAATRGNAGPVSAVPMRFGTIFKDIVSLKETLAADYSRISALFDKIRGKQEWSVKIYLTDSKKLESMVRERTDEIRLKEKELASMPEGLAYFMEEELKRVIFDAVNKELGGILYNLYERLGEDAADSVKTRILEREMTGRTEKMIFNTAFLIRRDKVDVFKGKLEEIGKEFPAKGLSLEYSGPWPPFNFCERWVHDPPRSGEGSAL